MSKDYQLNYYGYDKYALYSLEGNVAAQNLFSDSTIKNISQTVTHYLKGVDLNGKNIVVPDATIKSVLSDIFLHYYPNTGDIYTRLNIEKKPINDYEYIVQQTINTIVNDVKNNYGMMQQNALLSVWDTVLGDSNRHGLRSHDIIKIRKKRPMPMMFNMNY